MQAPVGREVIGERDNLQVTTPPRLAWILSAITMNVKPRLRDDGRLERLRLPCRRAPRTAPAPGRVLDFDARQPFLTVPLLCSAASSAVPGQTSAPGRAPPRAATGRARRPQVDHVALLAALLGRSTGRRWSSRFTLKVRPRPSPRWSGQAQRRCGPLPRSRADRPEVVEHARQRQLPLEVGEVDGRRSRRPARRLGYAVGAGRGDHCPRRLASGLWPAAWLRADMPLSLVWPSSDMPLSLAFDVGRRLPGIVVAGRTAGRSSRWRRPGAAACAWRGRWRWPCAAGCLATTRAYKRPHGRVEAHGADSAPSTGSGAPGRCRAGS